METNWRINFKYIQNIISGFVFEDILNLFSIYSEFIHWINRPVPAVSRSGTPTILNNILHFQPYLCQFWANKYVFGYVLKGI